MICTLCKIYYIRFWLVIEDLKDRWAIYSIANTSSFSKQLATIQLASETTDVFLLPSFLYRIKCFVYRVCLFANLAMEQTFPRFFGGLFDEIYCFLLDVYCLLLEVNDELLHGWGGALMLSPIEAFVCIHFKIKKNTSNFGSQSFDSKIVPFC